MPFRYFDAERDADAYYGYLETKQAMWEERCEQCAICGGAIDPDYDPNCIQLGNRYAHIQCMSEKIEKSNIAEFLKEWITEAVEEYYYASTPIPEE